MPNSPDNPTWLIAGYAPEPNLETKKKDVVWFALNESRPLFAFAGVWTEFKGERGCACRKSHPAILMVQSAQDRAADDIPGPLNAARDRGILVQ
jgi:putative SOS response-associated peptidase YedK